MTRAATTARSTLLQHATWPALLAAAAWSALALYFATAGNDITLLAWIAPVPILAFVFAHGAAARQAARSTESSVAASGRADARLAVAAFLAGFGGSLSWVVLYWGVLPAPAMTAFAALIGAGLAVSVLVTSLVTSRLGGVAGTLAFASAWVSFEFAVSRFSPHGTAGSLAYSQVDILPLLQVSAWTGLAGISFVISLAAASIAALIGDRPSRGIRWRFVVLPVLALAAVLGAGQARILTLPRQGLVTVGLVSVDEAMREADTTSRERALQVLMAYLESAGTLASRGAEAVVLPEKLVGVTPEYEDQVASLLSSLAEKDGIIVAAGLNKVGREPKRNVADVFAKGRRVLEYEKQRLVPGFEAGYARGSRPGIYRAPGGVTGTAICKDLDFAAIGREYGRAGVGILFVPAWDFGRDARVHSRMALVRGVEGGYSIARTAANGLLTGSDYLGRVIAERPSDAAPQSMLLVQLPLGAGKTFYSEHGDWFAWLNVAAVAALVLLAAIRR